MTYAIVIIYLQQKCVSATDWTLLNPFISLEWRISKQSGWDNNKYLFANGNFLQLNNVLKTIFYSYI